MSTVDNGNKSKLYFIRRNLGLTLREMELVTGISHGTLNRIENNIGSPTYATLKIIADALDIDISALYD